MRSGERHSVCCRGHGLSADFSSLEVPIQLPSPQLSCCTLPPQLPLHQPVRPQPASTPRLDVPGFLGFLLRQTLRQPHHPILRLHALGLYRKLPPASIVAYNNTSPSFCDAGRVCAYIIYISSHVQGMRAKDGGCGYKDARKI